MTELPNIIDPVRVAKKGFRWDAFVKISALPALADMLLLQGEPLATVHILCKQDDLWRNIIEGEVLATVSLPCQRCLESLTLDLVGHFKICVVQTEAQAEALPPEYEPSMQTADGLSLWDLVEESLILAIPDAPKHPEDICQLANNLF